MAHFWKKKKKKKKRGMIRNFRFQISFDDFAHEERFNQM